VGINISWVVTSSKRLEVGGTAILQAFKDYLNSFELTKARSQYLKVKSQKFLHDFFQISMKRGERKARRSIQKSKSIQKTLFKYDLII